MQALPSLNFDPRRTDVVRVMIVDDTRLFREVACAVVDAARGFEPVGSVDSGAQALARFDELVPDLVLMDVRMPGMNGIETTRRLTAAHPEAIVVLISSDDLAGVCHAAESCGAAGFVPKQDLTPDSLRRIWSAQSRSS